MPLINYTRLYADRVRTLLEPGEDLRVVGRFGLAIGDDDELQLPYAYQGFGERYATRKSGPKLDVRERESRGLIAGWGAFGIIWSPRITSAILRFLIAPLQAAGGPGSCAAQFVVDLKRADHPTTCAATDRRLVVLKRAYPKAGEAPQSSFTVAAVISRDQIAKVRTAGRVLLLPQRGRVLFTFIDGSEVAILTGLLTTGTAKAIVEALTS
jgi:hypothetical protein